MRAKKVLFTATALMVTNLLVKFFGLFREILLAQYYGTSVYTDAYIIANNIPTVLFAAFGVSLSTTFIPMYSKVREEKGDVAANSFTLHLSSIVLFICAIITIIGEIFAKQVVLVFASGFAGTQLDITISFARILFPSVFGLALMNLMGSYLQLQGKFLPISLVPMFGNLVIIASLILSNILGNVLVFVWGTLIGLLVQVLFYLPWIIRQRLFEAPISGLRNDKYIRELIPLVTPVFLGDAVNEINSIVDRTLVSGLSTGSVSYLNYSYKVINLIIGVVVVSLITIIYPKISKVFAEGKKEKFSTYCASSLNIIATCIFPIMFLVLFFKNDIVCILYQRGSFDAVSTSMTAMALGCYALGIVAMSIRELCAKVFYSMQDTKTPMKNGVFCAVVNIVLDILLILYFGFKGAALATAIAAWVGALLLFIKLTKLRVYKVKTSINVTLKCLVGIFVGMVFLYIWRDCVLNTHASALFYYTMCVVGGILFIMMYFGIQFLLRNNIIKNFKELQ